MSKEYDSTEYLKWKSYCRVKNRMREKLIGKTYLMDKDSDKSETSTGNSSPAYQAYIPIVVSKP